MTNYVNSQIKNDNQDIITNIREKFSKEFKDGEASLLFLKGLEQQIGHLNSQDITKFN